MPWWRRHWPILTLVLLPLFPLWRAVFLGECIGPWDQIMQMAPWNGPKPTSAWDVLQADGVLQFYPWRDLVFDAWGKGQLPLWNPYQLCGTPLLANSQSAGFYPLHILMGVLHVPTAIAITLLAWFHLAWAGLGARYLAKLCGANEYGAVAAGAGFGVSAFMVAWTPLASVVTTCSWIPWVLVCAKQVVESQGNRRWAAALAGSVAMMLLGGHLQFAAYGLIGLLVFGLWSAIAAKSKLIVYGLSVTGVLLGALLAAPQILPATAFSTLSHRQVEASSDGATAYGQSALQLQDLVGFVAPALSGLPGHNVVVGGEPVPSYWPGYLKRGGAFAEGALSVGPLIVFLLFYAKRKKLKENAGLWSLAVVGLLLALGPLSVAMYWTVPGWASTGSPGRASILVVLAVSVAAGCFWPEDSDPKSKVRNWIGLAAALLVSAVLAISLATTIKPWIPGLESAQPIALESLQQPLGLIAVLILGAGLLVKHKQAGWMLGAGLAATLVSGALFCLPSGHPLISKTTPDPNVRHAFVNSDWGLLNAAHANMPGNTASASRAYDIAGYDSLLSKDTLEMLRAVNNGQDPAPPANGNMMFVKPGFDPVKLAEAGVTLVQTADGQTVDLPGPGRASTDLGPAKIVEDGYDRQRIEVTGPGTLTVRDRNLPGWSATVDGRPVEIRPGLWRVVDLPEGTHAVEFRYSPPGLRTGFSAFAFGLVLTVALAWPAFRRRRPTDRSIVDDGNNLAIGP